MIYWLVAISLLLIGGALGFPFVFRLKLKWTNKLSYQFFIYRFDITDFLIRFLESDSSSQKSIQKKAPSPNPQKKKTKKAKQGFLNRFLKSYRFYLPLSQWLLKGVLLFSPLSIPRWKMILIEIGHPNPFDTYQSIAKISLVAPLIPCDKLVLTPCWNHSKLQISGEAEWRIYPIVVLFRMLKWFLSFPFLPFFKSLYLALRPSKWQAKHPNWTRWVNKLFGAPLYQFIRSTLNHIERLFKV